MSSRFAAVSATLLTVAVLTAGCADTPVARDGIAVDNAADVLDQADGLFEDMVAADVSSEAATVAENSRCYFRRLTDDDAESRTPVPLGEADVDTDLYCGPVRYHDTPADLAWVLLATRISDETEDAVSIALVDAGDVDRRTAADLDELVRPDGAEPVPSSALPTPRAPLAPVSDFATLVELDTVDSPGLTALDRPRTITTAAATITVDAVAELTAIPAPVIDIVQHHRARTTFAGTFAAEHATAYRPAAGQYARAWHLTIVGPASTAGSVSAALGVRAGTLALPVHGCTAVPCPASTSQEYLLVTSSSAVDSLSLHARVGADAGILALPGDVS